jgi:hypothetical protein
MRRCILNMLMNLDRDKHQKKWNILKKFKELYSLLKSLMIKMVYTGSKSCWFNSKDIVISALETKPLFY